MRFKPSDDVTKKQVNCLHLNLVTLYSNGEPFGLGCPECKRVWPQGIGEDKDNYRTIVLVK